MAVEVDAPLLKWGNSYALRITKAQAEALGARPGQPLHATIEVAGMPTWSFPTFASGCTDTSLRHDEILEEAIEDEVASWREQ